MLRQGDVVFSRVGSVDRNALIKATEDGWLFSGRLLRVRPAREISSTYLSYHFHSEAFKQRVRDVAVGQTMASINTKILMGVKAIIPPSFAEQEAIAEALSDADALIEALEQLLAKKRQVKQGAMQELLTGKRRLPGFTKKTGYNQTEFGAIPNDWEIQQLSAFVLDHNAGVYKKQELYGKGCNIVGVSDIYSIDKINGQEFSRVPLTDQELKRYALKANDLIYGESSLVREGIARTVYVTEAGAGTAFAWHTRRYSINQTALISSYLYYYLNSPIARKHMMEKSIQTALTGINTVEYFSCPILLPSIPEQTAIAEILSDMDAEIAALEGKLSKARQVKQGMMQELLTGRVRLV